MLVFLHYYLVTLHGRCEDRNRYITITQMLAQLKTFVGYLSFERQTKLSILFPL